MIEKIVIFGATGQIGICSINAAINQGLKTRIFIKDENKIPADFKYKVDTVVGDVLNPDHVSEAIKGMDAVIVTLGKGIDYGSTAILSQGITNIIAGMKKHNVTVVSMCSSMILLYEDIPENCKDIRDDYSRMFDLMKVSELKYIIVYAPFVDDSPRSKYLVEYDDVSGKFISKWDIGSFMVECLTQPEYYGRAIGISNPPDSIISGRNKILTIINKK